MLRERPLGQESELKTQRQRFSKSRTIWRMLNLRDWRPEIPKRCFQRWWSLSESSLSDLESSDDGEDVEDEDDEETEQGKLSEDDEPGWVMGIITTIVQQCIERFRQKQMKFHELTQPGWENAVEYFGKWDKNYGTSEVRVLAVVQLQMNVNAPPHPPTTFAKIMKRLDIVSGISQGTSRPGSSHIRLGSVKPQSKWSIPCGELAAGPDSSLLLKAKPV